MVKTDFEKFIISIHSEQTLSRIKKDADRDFWMSSEEAK